MKRAIMICAPLMLLASCANISDVENLSIGDVRIKDIKNSVAVAQALIPISDENEVILGRGVAVKVMDRFALLDNPELTHYINLLGTTIAQRSERPEIAYHFAILDTDEINAYSCPGGFIFVTRGIINIVKDEAELGAVLAHEIAHVSERHIVKALQRSEIMRAGAKLTEDAFNHGGPLFDQMIDAATDSLFEGLDKNDEFSADALAVSYLNRVGYDYLAMSDVLNILNEKHKSDTMKVISKTHPSPEERQQQLQKAIRDMSLAATTGVRLKSRFEKHT